MRKIFEGIEGSKSLKPIYNKLNKEIFSNALPNIKVGWNGKLKRAIGQATVRYKGTKIKKNKLSSFISRYEEEIPQSDIEINMSSLEIKISKNFDMDMDTLKAVMIHEMVHILLYTQKKLGGHHGSMEFDGWIKKTRDISGLNVPYLESDIKSSPKIIPKTGFVYILELGNNKYGINHISDNIIEKKFMEFTSLLTRIVGTRIKKAELYKVTHSYIAKKTAVRALNKISWQQEDKELIDEIRNKGMFIGMTDRSGGAFTYKYFDVTYDKNGKTI